ncbi:hypothetical protein StoSoilB13_27330 (plasmid) [Arthrobacter sp. StoSoilB13]|nr:hypothetical protein StoSoilB13_27330 [Arthrobacter sp. StoSoilB13]
MSANNQAPVASATGTVGKSHFSAPELELEGITKSYPGVKALKGVSFSVGRGSIHALAGQNGAGKSTLVKILSGAESPDSGSIRLGGELQRFRDPMDAQQAGIHTIYQELSLVPSLSVAENIFLGQLPLRGGAAVDWQRMQAQARAALDRVGFDLDVRRPVASYSTAEQQAVELAKALHKDARVLLLDEPTSTLPMPDVERLFTVLRSLSEQGVTLLYISHRMDELFSLCDAVTVLRDGVNAADLKTADSKPADVVTAMVGKSLEGSIAEAALRGERSPSLGAGPPGRASSSQPATSPRRGTWTRCRSNCMKARSSAFPGSSAVASQNSLASSRVRGAGPQARSASTGKQWTSVPRAMRSAEGSGCCRRTGKPQASSRTWASPATSPWPAFRSSAG